MPRYRWASAPEWLSWKVNSHNDDAWDTDAVYEALALIIPRLDADTIQDLFQDNMDKDGFFVDLEDKERHIVKAWTTLDANGDYEDVYTDFEVAKQHHHPNQLHEGFTTTTDWEDGESFYPTMEEIAGDLGAGGYIPVDYTQNPQEARR